MKLEEADLQTAQEPGLQQKREARRNVLGLIRNTDTQAALSSQLEPGWFSTNSWPKYSSSVEPH